MKQTARKGSYMNVEIAQRLAEMRRAKGYSQEELAEKLGLSRQAVSKWERAESSPDTGNIIALAKLYGVTIDELLRIDDDVADDVAFESRDRAASAQPPRAQAAAEPRRPRRPAAQETQAQAAAASPAQPPPQPQAQARGLPAAGAPRVRAAGIRGAPWRGPPAQPQPPHAAYQQAAYHIPLPSRPKPPISRLRTSPSRKLPAARRRHPRSTSTARGRRFPTRSFASSCSCWPGSSCRHGTLHGWCSSPYLCITG